MKREELGVFRLPLPPHPIEIKVLKVANELILIIEDNEKNRKLCRDVLNVKGYKTIESETAEEGLKLAREKESESGSDGYSASRNRWYYGDEAASSGS